MNTYLKKRIGKKYEKQKKWLKLISFLTEEKMLLTLQMATFLDLKKETEEEPEPGLSKPKTKRKKSPLKREEFINETKNDKEDINEQIFKE